MKMLKRKCSFPDELQKKSTSVFIVVVAHGRNCVPSAKLKLMYLSQTKALETWKTTLTLISMLWGHYLCSNHRNWYYFANRMDVVLIQKSREIWQGFFNRLFWDQNFQFKQKSNALSRYWYFCTTPTGQEGCSLFGFSVYGHTRKMSPKTECNHSRTQHTPNTQIKDKKKKEKIQRMNDKLLNSSQVLLIHKRVTDAYIWRCRLLAVQQHILSLSRCPGATNKSLDF